MNLSVALLIIPTLCYIGIGVNEALRRNGPGFIVFWGYAFANLGLLWGLWR